MAEMLDHVTRVSRAKCGHSRIGEDKDVGAIEDGRSLDVDLSADLQQRNWVLLHGTQLPGAFIAVVEVVDPCELIILRALDQDWLGVFENKGVDRLANLGWEFSELVRLDMVAQIKLEKTWSWTAVCSQRADERKVGWVQLFESETPQNAVCELEGVERS